MIDTEYKQDILFMKIDYYKRELYNSLFSRVQTSNKAFQVCLMTRDILSKDEHIMRT